MKYMRLEEKEDDMKRCIHYRQQVKHYNGNPKPNCMTCDGYGIDAKKNGWRCYVSKEEWMYKNGTKR